MYSDSQIPPSLFPLCTVSLYMKRQTKIYKPNQRANNAQENTQTYTTSNTPHRSSIKIPLRKGGKNIYISL